MQRHRAAVRRVQAANRQAGVEAWRMLSASFPPAGSSAALAGGAGGVGARGPRPVLPPWARRIPIGHTPFLVGGAIACDRCGATRTMDTMRGLLFQPCRGSAPAGTWDRIVGMKRGRPPSQVPCWPDGLGPGPRPWHRLTWRSGQWEVGAAQPSPEEAAQGPARARAGSAPPGRLPQPARAAADGSLPAPRASASERLAALRERIRLRANAPRAGGAFAGL